MRVEAGPALIGEVMQAMRVEGFASTHKISKAFLAYFAKSSSGVSLLAIGHINFHDGETDNRQRFENKFVCSQIVGDKGIELAEDGVVYELVIY